MKTEQVNLRLEVDLIAAIQQAAQEESLDRGTIIRKLLLRGLALRRVDRALEQYQLGDISIGRAAEDAGLTHWEIMDEARRRGIAYPLDVAELEAELQSLRKQPPRVAEASPVYGTRPTRIVGGIPTLPDHPPKPGRVLLIGLNPAPISIQAGHYYQGRLGKRLWRKLARLGLLEDAVPGAEDDAFVEAGHGLTDLVKQPTLASKVSREEIRRGREELRRKVMAWQPGLIIFVFKEAARAATGASDVAAGEGPPFEGVPTFLLSGPYSTPEVSGAVERELRRLLSTIPTAAPEGTTTQTVTASDIKDGIIRLPPEARHFFRETPGPMTIVLRGMRLDVRYEPKVGSQPRSAVLRIGRETLAKLVKPGETLRVSRTADGGTTLV